ncbi:MAG: carboxymuconolactone decarboxylase family protein [Usitatibacter sp.]
MPHVPLLKPEQAPKEVKSVYEEFHTRMSFPSPPNFIMTQGHSSTVARGTWEAVRNILVMGEIPRWTKEMMFVAISVDRGCRYCTAAHIACCRMLGVTPALLESLVRDVKGMSDWRLRDMILFALKCSRNPQSLTEPDFDQLRRHGLKQSEIVETIAMSAFAVYANIIADATAMEQDEMFATV